MSVALCDRLRGPEVNVQLGFCGLRNRQVSQTFLGRPLRVINGPRAASELGPLIPGQRTCSDYFSMSVSCRYCCKSRKSNDPKNLAKVDF